jgi:hypothetical protein
MDKGGGPILERDWWYSSDPSSLVSSLPFWMASHVFQCFCFVLIGSRPHPPLLLAKYFEE